MLFSSTDSALEQIAGQIGPGINNLGFRIALQGGARSLILEDFRLSVSEEPDGTILFHGEQEACRIIWSFQPYKDGFWVTLKLAGEGGLNCSELESLSFDYYPPNGAVDDLRIPTLGQGVEAVGIFQPRSLTEQLSRGSLLRGAFQDSRSAGVFVATRLPQKHKHYYTVEKTNLGCLHFAAATHYLPSISKSRNLISETTWICAQYHLQAALENYGAAIPVHEQEVPVGWSSWDYYFFSVTLDDVLENMDEIRKDPVLANTLNTIVVDDGWQHMNGEWQPNYKFPGGLERLVNEIRSRNFIPGIWTAPILVNANSAAALRQSEMLVKNHYGDPLAADVPGHYMLDPTHPKGRAFLVELYTRLYRAGFRFFKADFVSSLLDGQYFYNPSKGPYEVIAELFQIIRACITPDSHLMGCSLPEECGPGLADSHRTGIDIHNQWTHVEWATQSLQMAGWQHKRLGINDSDFLIVRGPDTSWEIETNVLNPEAHNPDPPRWRRGEVFNLEEARTWGMLVSLSGGSVFLGDRLSRLNAVGREILHKLVNPAGAAARPLDLGDAPYPALWLVDLADEYRLGMINWSEDSQDLVMNFAQYEIPRPDQIQDFWNGHSIPVDPDIFRVHLPGHGSFYGYWKKNTREKSNGEQ